MVDNGGLKNMIQLFLRISLYIYFQENKLSMISFKLKTQGSKKKKNPGIKPRSPALQADSLPAEPQGKPQIKNRVH